MSAEGKKKTRAKKAKAVEKRSIGRPTLYQPEMGDRIIAMGAEGYTVVEMAVELGITKSSLYKYVEDHEEFSDAFTRARELAEAFHAKNFRTQCGLPQAVFNANGYAKFMGICFKDWRDPTKVEVSGVEGGPVVFAWQAPSPA
jgi:transposase-like protein